MSAPRGDARDTADDRARDHDAAEPPEPGPAPCAGVESGPACTEGALRAGQESEAPGTGLDAVDRVLEREEGIAQLPVTERAAAYEELHRELERILSEDPGKLPHGLAPAAGPEGAHPGAPGQWRER